MEATGCPQAPNLHTPLLIKGYIFHFQFGRKNKIALEKQAPEVKIHIYSFHILSVTTKNLLVNTFYRCTTYLDPPLHHQLKWTLPVCLGQRPLPGFLLRHRISPMNSVCQSGRQKRKLVEIL